MRFGAGVGCHQKAERSFFFKGYQFPVCARCTGVLLGELLGVVLLLCGLRFHVLWTIALILPLAVDGGLQLFGFLESTNIRRVITGTLAGTALVYLYSFLFTLVCRMFGWA